MDLHPVKASFFRTGRGFTEVFNHIPDIFPYHFTIERAVFISHYRWPPGFLPGDFPVGEAAGMRKLQNDATARLVNSRCHLRQTWDEIVIIYSQLPHTRLPFASHIGVTGYYESQPLPEQAAP